MLWYFRLAREVAREDDHCILKRVLTVNPYFGFSVAYHYIIRQDVPIRVEPGDFHDSLTTCAVHFGESGKVDMFRCFIEGLSPTFTIDPDGWAVSYAAMCGHVSFMETAS